MTNKLKGILIGFSSFFVIGFIERFFDHGYNIGVEEFGFLPFFLGLLGLIIGYLVGASIKEKN